MCSVQRHFHSTLYWPFVTLAPHTMQPPLSCCGKWGILEGKPVCRPKEMDPTYLAKTGTALLLLYTSKSAPNAYLKSAFLQFNSLCWRYYYWHPVINNTSFFHHDQSSRGEITVLFRLNGNPLFISSSGNIWRQHVKLSLPVSRSMSSESWMYLSYVSICKKKKEQRKEKLKEREKNSLFQIMSMCTFLPQAFIHNLARKPG